MYYATYKDVGDCDIAAFQTKQDRDDWVKFKDPYSNAIGASVGNSTFERKAISAEEAEMRIKTMLHIKDEFNDGQEWYCAI